MARNQMTIKTMTQYGLFAIIVVIVYRIYSGDDKKAKNSQSIRPDSDQDSADGGHPRNVHSPRNEKSLEELDKSWSGVEEAPDGKRRDSWGERVAKERKGWGHNGEEERVNLNAPRDPLDELVEGAGESGRNDQSRKREVNVGEIPKDHDPHDSLDDFMVNQVKDNFKLGEKVENKLFRDGVDPELTKELQNRVALYNERLEIKKVNVPPQAFKHMHEDNDEFFPFATAGSHTTYPATLEFIFSIQYFYPATEISIYDIGLFPEERDFINSLCNVKVESLWIHLWPEDMYKNRHRTWRPTLLQFAVAKYGDVVYVEPGRYINKQRLKEYIRHSQINGVTVVGSQLKHSTYSVTHPTMYSFLPADEQKIKKFPHFNFNMIIIHNTDRVRNYFMRYLISCVREEYCIAPPGAKYGCDGTLEYSRRWANCHRFDESAMNIILNTWHNYNADEYLMKDAITKHYDGKDVTKKLKVCAPPVDNSHKEEI